jgi:AcrR family transcriptional regulator
LDQAPNSGRTNQKARTRAAILASAAQLIRDGHRPTVEEAALAVGISKRTAYRYFASQEHLLADAVLDTLRQRMDELLAPSAASEDVHARVTALAIALNRLAETHEAELRVMIRTALDRGRVEDPGMRPRGQRRLLWIETALKPIQDQLPKERYLRLVNSLAVCLGVDALLVLRDVCGIAGSAAEETMVWMANTILDRALAE